MTRSIRTDSHFLVHVFIICTALLIFSPCLFSFFVSDDFIWMKRGANFSFDDLFRSSKNPDYNIFRPLVPALFFMLKRLLGLSPYGYHLTSILLHVSNSLLIYHILLHFPLPKNIMALSSVVFVSHFAQEETVFWISGISLPLGCFFYLLSILTFLMWLKNGRIWTYLVSLGLGVIAFFIREDALTLPLILSLIIGQKYFRSKQVIPNSLSHKTKRRTWVSVIPFFSFNSFILET